MSDPAPAPAQGGPSLEEERPKVDPAKAAAEERAALDDAIRSESDASASDRSRTGAGADKNGSPGGIPADRGPADAGPRFDREAAKVAREKTPLEEMKNLDGSALFSADDLELAKLDLKALKKQKPAERKKILERFGAVDLDDLQKKRDTLSDRKGAWVKRRVEDDEKEFRAGRAQERAHSREELRRRFLAKFTGREPWMAANGAIAKGIASKRVGPWAAELATSGEDVAILEVPTKMVVEKHADLILDALRLIPPEVLLFGAVAFVFAPKCFDAYARWKDERERREKEKKEERKGTGAGAAPSKN